MAEVEERTRWAGAGDRPAVVAGGVRPALTRFFGREAEIAEVRRLMARARLVTLAGAPGCGKTRLAMELVSGVADRLCGDVRAVELAPVVGAASVAAAVATALDLPEQPGRSTEELLAEALVGRDVVIVLDNCEHVAGAVAALVERLLARCPAVRVLATSRVALGVPGEQVWRLPPLDLGPAVELFRDRARLSCPDADLDGATAVIELICARLAGLPLAIELAAPWTRVLPPAAILDRLDHALPDFLRSGARHPNPRHHTMEATVRWSYELLQPADRLLFERLSVFAGGFDLEAAQAVAPERDVLGGLTSLVDQSLVVAERLSCGTIRYRLLEPVRQFAEAWLARRGDGDATRLRHARHYLGVAVRADASLRTSALPAVLGELEQEEDNLRTALDWARRQPGDLGLRLCTALARSWALRGRVNEGRAWMEEMLARDTPDRRLRASALARASRLAWRQLDYPATRKHLEASLTLERELGDELRAARRLRSLATVAMAEGDLAEAETLCTRSIAVFRSRGDDYETGLALAFLGLTLQLVGEDARAHQCLCEALDLNRATGNVAGTVYSLGGIAFRTIATGDPRDLRPLATEAMTLLAEIGGLPEDPAWLWFAIAFAGAEDRHRSVLRLGGAVDALARRDGIHLHEQFRQHVVPWLERARAHVGPAEAARLADEGARLTLDALRDEVLRQPEDNEDCPLSPRELQTAGLVADGMTNGEIAQHLVISKRTVESHVEHIKSKLGLTRRAQIVAWVHERRPPTPDSGRPRDAHQ